MRANDGEFRGLVEQHQSMVFSIALRILGDRGAAEEVAQDVFVELHRSLGRLESEEHVLFWLRRVAVHRATDHLRRRSLRPEVMAEGGTGEHYRHVGGGSFDVGAGGARLGGMVLSLPRGVRSGSV